MAHMIEEINGVAQMAYAGDVPWHSLGKPVPPDLSPKQMLEAAGVNWTVRKVPAFANVNGKSVAVGRSALVRDSDDSILDVVSDDWNILQNENAFEFFHDFVAAGEMEMHTAGSLRNGQIVWALAKVNDGFELFKGDTVDSYLLFTNPHRYGWSIDVRFSPIRTVCWNTLTLSLNTISTNMVKVSHRRKFDADMEMAAYLGAKRYTEQSLVEYFKKVFPMTGTKEQDKMSRSASNALDIIHTQPGATYAEGSYWQAWNATTYMVDHVIGRNNDNRLTSAWYGQGKTLKNKALELAITMAEAA